MTKDAMALTIVACFFKHLPEWSFSRSYILFLDGLVDLTENTEIIARQRARNR